MSITWAADSPQEYAVSRRSTQLFCATVVFDPCKDALGLFFGYSDEPPDALNLEPGDLFHPATYSVVADFPQLG